MEVYAVSDLHGQYRTFEKGLRYGIPGPYSIKPYIVCDFFGHNNRWYFCRIFQVETLRKK